jgi:glycosyltransferase involved in cell wall biosynthesis
MEKQNFKKKSCLLVWILQTGEPLQIDSEDARPMRAMNLSNALAKEGHKVVLWSSEFYHQKKKHRKYNTTHIAVSENIEIRLIKSCGYQKNIGFGRLIDHAQLAYNLKKMLKKCQDIPDVAFIGYPPIETAMVMTKWLSKYRVPSLIDVKDMWPSLFLNAVPLWLRPLAVWFFSPYYYLGRKAIRTSTGICAMSKGYLDWSTNFGNRCHNEMDGIFPLTSPKEKMSEFELRKARKWWDEKKIYCDNSIRICFIGSHMSIYDFEPVKKAAQISLKSESKCQFIICGDGGCSSEIRTMMSGLPNVYFPGWIDRPKIEALAERSTAAIAPYLNIDNFNKNVPNKIIDALSLGLPILSPLEGEVAAIIKKYNVGMSYGGCNRKHLSECIDILAENVGKRERMAKEAVKLYESKFNFNVIYTNLVLHIEKIYQKKNYAMYD